MAWSKKQLISTCSNLRDTVVAREYASVDELSDHWPVECGCAPKRAQLCSRCRRASKHDWYITHSHLVAFIKRGEWLAVSRRQDADEQLLAQLDEEPHRMRLLDGRELTLYPKGFHALKFIQGRDWLCSWLASIEQMVQHHVNEMRLTRDQLAEPVTVLDMVAQELATQLSIIMRVITYPGAGLPPTDELVNPCEEYMDVLPLDVARVNKKFMELNIPQLALVPYLMGPQKPGKDEKRRGWTVFYTRAGKIYNRDPQDLMHNKALAALIVDMKLRAVDMEEMSKARA